MDKRNPRVSFKGIPAKARKEVQERLDFYARIGSRMTPTEIYQDIAEHKVMMAKREAQDAEDRARKAAENVREAALKSLRTALDRLWIACILAEAIRDEKEGPLDSLDTASLTALSISDAGAALEQALCDLGLIGEDRSYFVESLESRGVKMAAKEAA